MPGPRPETNGRREIPLACRDFAGVIELDGDGIPVVFRRRCKSRQCCPPKEGHIAVHRFTLYGVQNGREVGEYVTHYLPMRPVSELLPVK